MAFDPISYTYVPTAPRPKKRTKPHHKSYPKSSGAHDKNQGSKPNEEPLGITQLSSAAAAHDMGSNRTHVQAEIDAVCDSNSNDNNDDDDFPTIEEILGTALQEQGFPIEDHSTNSTNKGFEKVALGEREGSIDHSGSAPSHSSGKSQDNPIVLGDDDPSDYDCGSQRAESTESDSAPFSSPQTTFDSRTSVSPGPGECHDIESAQHLQLAEQDTSTPDSTRPYSPSSRPLSESLHDCIDAEDNSIDHARSEAATSHSAQPCNQSPCHPRLLPLDQLSQEDHLQTDRSATDEHEPVRPLLNANKEDEKQEVSGGSDVDDDDNAQPQRQISPKPSQDARGSHGDGCSDDELSSSDAESDGEARRPRPKRQQPPLSSHAGPAQKKRKHHLQQRSTRQSKARSNSCRFSLKSQSVLDRVLRATSDPGAEGRLPSPAPSAARTINTEMLSYCCNLGQSSSDILPTLTEVTFRPHSTHCYSFTAVVKEGCGGHGVSFSQLVQLIESIGYIGKIDDFTIKPSQQHSFLVTGFSRHTSSQLSSSEVTLPTAAVASPTHRDATRIRPQHGKAVDAEALTSQGNNPSSGDNGDGLSDSDPDLSSNDDGCSSEDEQGRSRTSKRSQWSDLDEQRLLAWKKEGKSWDWIFRKFPGRTKPAVRTRWNMIRPRGE